MSQGKADRIIVVGAGQMGVGIAYSFAVSGCEVSIVDTNSTALSRARGAIEQLLQAAVQRNLLTQDLAAGALGRLSLNGGLDDSIGGCSLLIETATENLGVKQAIFKTAEPLVGADTLLATNTSALSITEIGSVLKSPDRMVGLHFFNPVHKMKLVEIVKGLMSSPSSIAAAREWVARIGKTSIVVNEAPGFTTSRMSALMGNEAMYMLSEGVATAEDIDTSLRLAFNHPMGPLELGDLTGWDTRLAVLQYLHGVYGEKFRPCPLIHKMVKAGRHGRKTGAGVYRYDPDGTRVPGSGLKASE